MAKLVTVETGNSDPLGREAVTKHKGVLKEAQINGAGECDSGSLDHETHNPLGRCYTVAAVEGYLRLSRTCLIYFHYCLEISNPIFAHRGFDQDSLGFIGVSICLDVTVE